MILFKFTISHFPGKDLIIADSLSRAPVTTPLTADKELQWEAIADVNCMMQNLHASEESLQEIKQYQEADGACQKIVAFCQSGCPEKNSLSSEVKCYFPVWLSRRECEGKVQEEVAPQSCTTESEQSSVHQNC